MKTKIKILSLFTMLCMGIGMTLQKAHAQEPILSLQVFYDELSPYGTWIETRSYGYVWIPDVDPGFAPYATNGYWVLTDYGWTWVSNYSWGWAPFHYGRWYFDEIFGPIWVPDNVWGPGWVTWRRSANYYGWAPIGPGVSIDVAYSNSYNIPYNQWTFVSGAYIGSTNINNYYISSSNNVTIINNSTVINNTRFERVHNVTFNKGPDRIEVEKRTGMTITPVVIKDSSRPGQTLEKNQLQIYRPAVQRNITTGPKPAPARVANLKDVKPASQRTGGTQPQKTIQPAEQHKSQPSQPSRTAQPADQHKTQPSQTPHTVQPADQHKTQPSQAPHTVQPADQHKKQSSQPAHTAEPAKKEAPQPQEQKPPKNIGG